MNGLPVLRRGQRALVIAKVTVSAALLAVLFWRVDRPAFVHSLTAIPLPIVLGCILLYVGTYGLSTLRWRCLLRAANIQISAGRIVVMYFEASFFNLFLPTLIGGDVVRGVLVYRASQGRDAALPSVVLDRVAGMAAMLLLAISALSLGYERLGDPHTAVLLTGTAAVFGSAVVLLFSSRAQSVVYRMFRRVGLSGVTAKLESMGGALQRYARYPWALAQAFGLSILLQGAVILTYALVGSGLKLTVPLLDYFVLVPLVTIVAMLPVSVAGLGVRESAAVYFFGKVGVDPASALGMSLIWFSLTVLVSSVGGVLFAIDQHLLKRG